MAFLKQYRLAQNIGLYMHLLLWRSVLDLLTGVTIYEDNNAKNEAAQAFPLAGKSAQFANRKRDLALANA